MFVKIKAATEYLETPKYKELYVNTNYIAFITTDRRRMMLELGNNRHLLYLDEESFENLINIIECKQGILEKWRSINNG